MSVGSIIGGVVGGVIGFIYGGPMGAYYGATIGFGIGMMIDPMTPDISGLGMPKPGEVVMSSEVGTPLADLAGTAEITGHLIFYGGERNEPVYTETSGGKGGGGSEQQVAGYKYYMSWGLGICSGKVDTLYAIYKNEDPNPVWSGELECPASGGMETILLYETVEQAVECTPSDYWIEYTDPCEGLTGEANQACLVEYAWYYTEAQDPCDGLTGEDSQSCLVEYAWWYAETTPWEGKTGMEALDLRNAYPWVTEHQAVTCDEEESGLIGSVDFYFGTDDHAANATVGTVISDSTLNTPYRNMCWAFFDDCYIGGYNRTPTYKFIVKKMPSNAFNASHEIQTYNVNPAHAMWYILSNLSGLPESWLHSADFSTLADTLFTESRGICLLFNKQQTVLNYLETINNHVDNILRFDSDGKFHPKLIRKDYTVGTLPTIDETVMIGEPSLNRRSFVDTINEVKVQYSELTGP